MFGFPSESFLTFLFLLLKYFIYSCKFKGIVPAYIAFKSFAKMQKETKYFLSKKEKQTPHSFKIMEI